jgi:hypothetical protein
LVVVALAVALLPAMCVTPAMAVWNSGTPFTTVVPDTEGSTASYTFGNFTTFWAENATGYSVTFPAGTDVSGATSVNPAGTVSVAGQTVNVTFDTPVPPTTVFTVTLGNIVNPPAGTNNVGQITFFSTWIFGIQLTLNVNTGDYTVTGGYLTMTITTPDPGQSVSFGSVNPGIPSSVETVTVVVDSSAAYTLSRTFGGDTALMGLAVTGDAIGSKPAGLGTFLDGYQVTPPWTTTPSVPLTATVVYTAVQN